MTCGKRWRRVAGWIVIPCGLVITSVVMLAATVFACTIYMGQLTLSPTSGGAGTRILTVASGLKPYPAKYALHFTPEGNDDCMAFTTDVTTLKTITTNSSGGWKVRVTIPSSAAPGSYQICGTELSPEQGGTATTHDYFTVT